MNPPDVVFYVASAAAAASTLLAVTRRNPVYSAAWMLVSLASVGVIYLLLHATFLFVIQVLLYAGAIMVLFVFVIMLLNPGPDDLAKDSPSTAQMVGAGLFAVALYALLSKAIVSGGAVDAVPAFTAAGSPQPPEEFGTVANAGKVLYDKYLVAFEMISVLITASIAAVVLLAKPKLEAGGGISFSENEIGGRRRFALAAAEAADKLEREGGGANGNGHGGHGHGHGHGHEAAVAGHDAHGKSGGAH